MSDKYPLWRLGDAETRAKKSGGSFQIPPKNQRLGVYPGRSVKLLFESLDSENPTGERMWVKVLSRNDNGYIGVLQNEAVSAIFPVRGETIHFQPKHITQIQEEKEEEASK